MSSSMNLMAQIKQVRVGLKHQIVSPCLCVQLCCLPQHI